MKYFFSAAFDPITVAHTSIIKAIQKLMKKEDQLTILITDYCEREYTVSLDDRFEMVRNTLSGKFKNTLTIVEQNTRTLHYLKENFKDQEDDITIVMGEDEWKELNENNIPHSSILLSTYKFVVINRYGNEVLYHRDNAIILNIEKVTNVSSSMVRNIFNKNPNCHYKDVQEYISRKTFESIKELELYNQNSSEYLVEEKNYLNELKKKGIPSISNTATIIAYHNDEVLLIRRKNPPCKNLWAFPGGFIEKSDYNLYETAQRELKEETSLDIPVEQFEQIKTYSDIVNTDYRIIDTVFCVRIKPKNVKRVISGDDAIEAKWFNINDLPSLAFNHLELIRDFLLKKDFEDSYFENLPITEI